MFDFRRFEHVFLCVLFGVTALVGAARLVVFWSQPEVQLTLAAESAAMVHTSSGGGEDAVTGLKGSVLAPLKPFPISRFAVVLYYLGVGWHCLVDASSSVSSDRSQPFVESDDRFILGAPNAAGALMPDGRVDINRATAEELQTLPGIGPALAARIIEMRERRGGFVYPEELLDVSGIGPARYERLLEYITIGPLEQ